MSSSTKIRRVVEGDCNDLVELYFNAFSSNKAYEYIFEPSQKIDGLKWLFRKRTEILLQHSTLFLCLTINDKGTGAVPCIKFSDKPNILNLTLRHGLLLWPFYWGFNSLSRALDLDDDNNQSPSIEDYELTMMAVHPDFQRKGHGKSLLSHFMEQLQQIISSSSPIRRKNTKEESNLDNDDDGDGDNISSIILSTQEKDNLLFYKNFGFQEIGFNNKHGFDNWKMKFPLLS